MSFSIVNLTAMTTLGHTVSIAAPASPSSATAATLEARLSPAPSEIAASDKKPSASAVQGQAADDGSEPKPEVDSAAPSAGANGIPNLAAHIQGGDPDGSENLLRQIARCLPPGLRPSLKTAHLQIELSRDGQLRLAPVMQTDVAYASKDALKAADRVVQAALQCGPYRTAMSSQLSFQLVPDFSFIDAPSGAQAR